MLGFLRKKNISRRNKIFLLIFLFVFAGVFFYVNPAFAIAGKILNVLTIILHAVVFSLGWLVGALVFILVLVAKTNEFIDVPAVQQGWVIVRNLCNMFFILILLVIAFATILRVESYNAKKLLPKLLIMAILINFSKTICGLIIDFAQVIMLTFVYSFEDVGGANFSKMLGLSWILTFDSFGKNTGGSMATFSAYVLAIIYSIIALITISAILGVLIVRIVMIWIYVVLSPLAYLAATIPQGAGFANKWWKDFLDYVTKGPVLAFFVWLSFISMQGVTTDPENNEDKSVYELLQIKESPDSEDLVKIDDSKQKAPESITKAGTPDHLIQFAISIGMLLGGLTIAQSAGGAMGKAANMGAKLTKGGLVAGADKLNRWQMTKAPLPFTKGKGTGVDLNFKRNFETLKAGRQRAVNRELREGKEKASRNADMGGVAGALTGMAAPGYFERYVSAQGLKSRIMPSTLKGKLTEKGMIKSIKDKKEGVDQKIQEKKEQKDAIYSQEEYDNSNSEIDKKEEQTISNIDNEVKSIETEKDELLSRKEDIQNNVINNSDLPIGDPRREEAKEEIDKIDSQVADKDAQIGRIEKTKEKEKEKIKQEKENLDDRRERAKEQGVFKGTKAEAEKAKQPLNEEIDALTKKSKGLKEEIAKRVYFDDEGKRERNSIVKEEENKIETNDEEQLVKLLKNAVASGDSYKSEAYLRKIASVRGTNTLLEESGYDQDKDGFSDFMKDIFEDKLNMSPQEAMRIQGNLDGVGLESGQRLLCKTVSIDDAGNFKRLTGRDASEEDKNKSDALYNMDVGKLDSETVARRRDRLSYGYEDSNNEFQWDSGGLQLFLNQLTGIAKELKGGRFNKNAATQIVSSPRSYKVLKKILSENKSLEEYIKAGMGNNATSEDFLEALKLRGGSTRSSEDPGRNININQYMESGNIVDNEEEEKEDEKEEKEEEKDRLS